MAKSSPGIPQISNYFTKNGALPLSRSLSICNKFNLILLTISAIFYTFESIRLRSKNPQQ
ncbi:MAG: hypothetical protein C6Y22_23505 [Hapalosiphonaceae cyanobacterium JJU2]|nr:MAG: hypothetical protein C6Y22_23505 [Hapalosiphonaceae cyanobacterium JJU2]